MPKVLVEIDVQPKDGHSAQPGSPQVVSAVQDTLIRVTDADGGLPWQVLRVREVPLRPGPGWIGYRDVTIALNIHVPAATDDRTVTDAVNNLLDDPPAGWAGWFAGMARVASSGYPDPDAGPPPGVPSVSVNDVLAGRLPPTASGVRWTDTNWTECRAHLARPTWNPTRNNTKTGVVLTGPISCNTCAEHSGASTSSDCWRWPEHHRCAVTLIGRQQEENSQLTGRAAAAERAVRDLAEAFGGTIGIDPRPPNPEFPWKVTTVDGAEWHTSAPDAAAAELIRHHRVTVRNRTPCPDCGGGYWQDYIGPPPVSQFIKHDHDCASAEGGCAGGR